jgi:hypothetical protein
MSCPQTCTVTVEENGKQEMKMILSKAEIHLTDFGWDYIKATEDILANPYNINGMLIKGLSKGDRIYPQIISSFQINSYTAVKIRAEGKAARKDGKIAPREYCGQKFEAVSGGDKVSEFVIYREKVSGASQPNCHIASYKLYNLLDTGLAKSSKEWKEGYEYNCGNLTFKGKGREIKGLECTVNASYSILLCSIKDKECPKSIFTLNIKDSTKLPIKINTQSNFKGAYLPKGNSRQMQLYADQIEAGDATIKLTKSKISDLKESIRRDQIIVQAKNIILHAGTIKPKNDRYTYILERPNFLFNGFLIDINPIDNTISTIRKNSGLVTEMTQQTSTNIQGASSQVKIAKTLQASVNPRKKTVTIKPRKADLPAFIPVNLVTDPKKGKQAATRKLGAAGATVKTTKTPSSEELTKDALSVLKANKCGIMKTVSETVWKRIETSKSPITKRTYYTILNGLPISPLQKASLAGSMAAESRAIPTAKPQHMTADCIGLYQFCADTAKGLAGPCYFGSKSKCYICSPQGCKIKDQRIEPEVAIAGSLGLYNQKIKSLNKFCKISSSEDDKVRFIILSKNAGEGVACAAIKATRKKDAQGQYNPTFEEVIKIIDEPFLASIPAYKAKMTKSEREEKARRLKCYVYNVMYYRARYSQYFLPKLLSAA